jgi:hypothetical protein
VLGLQVTVLGGVERLRVSNLSGETVLILAPGGEPLLRFTPKTVYRYEPVTARWHQVASDTTYAWAEPRISWNEGSPPDVVTADPDETHFIREWSIPGRDGDSAADGRVFLAAFGLTGVAILACAVYVARRRTSSSSRSA